MATGDIKNNLRKLRTQLRHMKYPGEVDRGIIDGTVASILPIWDFAFLEYSRPVAEFIATSNLSLCGKTDFRFVETVFKILRDIFNYKPPLTKDQIMSSGFVERKIIMTCDLLDLVKQRHIAMNRDPKTSVKSKTSKSRLTKQSSTVMSSRLGSTPQVRRVADQSQLSYRPASIAVVQATVFNSQGEPRPDDGYRSSNASPVPDERETNTSDTERKLTELEEGINVRMTEFEERMSLKLAEIEDRLNERLTRLESTLAERESSRDRDREHRENATANVDHNLESILGRLTLAESRIHLLQSQAPSGSGILPAAKPELPSSTKPVLTQGEPVDIITIAATSTSLLPPAYTDVRSTNHTVDSTVSEEAGTCITAAKTAPSTAQTDDTIPTSAASNDIEPEAVTAATVSAPSPTGCNADSTTAASIPGAMSEPTDEVTTTVIVDQTEQSTAQPGNVKISATDGDDVTSSTTEQPVGDSNFSSSVTETSEKVDRLLAMVKDTEAMLGMNSSLTNSEDN
ncbi:centrosomal protein of 44 kDa-like [Ptychodera flava]|uniref:centrosomal protein of 44 kDa-like n=1 Tax=Ptychodera flava TaxID=63121 RepID=UPI003969F98A